MVIALHLVDVRRVQSQFAHLQTIAHLIPIHGLRLTVFHFSIAIFFRITFLLDNVYANDEVSATLKWHVAIDYWLNK